MEALVGPDVRPDAPTREAHVLVHRGHMRLLVPPEGYKSKRWRAECRQNGVTPLETVAVGWDLMLQQGDPQQASTPGDAVAKCGRCKATKEALAGAKAAGHRREERLESNDKQRGT